MFVSSLALTRMKKLLGELRAALYKRVWVVTGVLAVSAAGSLRAGMASRATGGGARTPDRFPQS